MSIWPTHWDELVVGFGANVGTNFSVDFGVNVGTKDGKDVFANFGTSVVANLAAHFVMGRFGVNCWADIFADGRAGHLADFLSGQLHGRLGNFPERGLRTGELLGDELLDEWEQPRRDRGGEHAKKF